MLDRLLHLISAERTSANQKSFLPTFYQHQKVYDFSKKYIKDKDVIEIGCGTGFGAYNLSQFAREYMALDKDTYSIVENRRIFKRKNLKFVARDLYNFSPKKKYDVVISLQVIEHFEDVHEYLRKLISLLKDKGILVISTPNGRIQSYNENPYHYKEYTDRELSSLLSPFFHSIKLYGLHGNKVVRFYESQRKKKVLSVLNRDFLKIRMILPRKVRQIFFDLATTVTRTFLMKSNLNTLKITTKNYIITNETRNAIDLLAIAKK